LTRFSFLGEGSEDRLKKFVFPDINIRLLCSHKNIVGSIPAVTDSLSWDRSKLGNQGRNS
jgi:hypothetical protein